MIEKLKDYESRGLIKSQQHSTEDLHIWNYTPEVQYNKDLWDDITRMCRGLITDSHGHIVQRPFAKFFNAGEMEEDKPYDFEGATIQEKVDGSLGIMYWVDRVPYMASRGSFTSEQAVKATTMLQSIWHDYTRQLSNMFPRGCSVFENGEHYTHLFEIIYPENRIVVDYGKENRLIYLCSIDKKTGVSKIFTNTCFEPTKVYDLDSFQQLMDNQPPGQEMEGFVVRFSDDRRLKYKLEDYKRLHYIMTELTDRTIWEWCKDGENLHNHLEHVPDELYGQIERYVNELHSKYDTWDKEVCNIFHRVNPLDSRKEQAEETFKIINERNLSKNLSGAIFNLLDGKDYSIKLWDLVRPEAGRTFLNGNEVQTNIIF